MRRHPHPAVAAFIESHPSVDLFMPSPVVAEIRYGLRRLPQGRRRDELERDFGTFLEAGFAARVLAFDADCALGYAMARVAREQAGRPVPAMDALIGGMALAHGAALATRNRADFDGYGLSLVDPWQHR
jgi:predicted nucleic acid-binding protein